MSPFDLAPPRPSWSSPKMDRDKLRYGLRATETQSQVEAVEHEPGLTARYASIYRVSLPPPVPRDNPPERYLAYGTHNSAVPAFDLLCINPEQLHQVAWSDVHKTLFTHTEAKLNLGRSVIVLTGINLTDPEFTEAIGLRKLRRIRQFDLTKPAYITPQQVCVHGIRFLEG